MRYSGYVIAYYANARARKIGHASRRTVLYVRTRGAVSLICLHIQFSLQHRLAASVGIILARLNVVDTRWVTSGASLCVQRVKLTTGRIGF